MSERADDGRRRTVTDEPFAIAPEVLGRELATIRRRGMALLVDAVVWLLLGVPLLVGMAYAVLAVEAPAAARDLPSMMIGAPAEDPYRGVAELLALVRKRRRGAVPPRFAEALAAGDLERVEEILREDDLREMFLLPDRADPSYYDPATDTLHVHRDVFFGRLGGPLGLGGIAILYFTLAAWIGSGRTPGKWLLGIRVLRLDGRALRLRDTFDRAGGYAAALSTLGLGFLEARWDDNRQALHDRMAGTVVVRDPRRGAVLWLREATGRLREEVRRRRS